MTFRKAVSDGRYALQAGKHFALCCDAFSHYSSILSYAPPPPPPDNDDPDAQLDDEDPVPEPDEGGIFTVYDGTLLFALLTSSDRKLLQIIKNKTPGVVEKWVRVSAFTF